jgi:predicted ATPase
MRVALAAHDRILRATIEDHDGYIFSTAGDAFSAAFWTPTEAVEAAVEGQRRLTAESWPSGVTLRVRMGVHTGTAEERNGDYFGPAVNRAARVMAAGHGGQVLLSLATEELICDRLPDGVTLVDLGEQRLIGLARPERLFQVRGPGLRSRFPRLAAMAPGGQIPRPVTSFVGHGDDLTRLAVELTRRPLVTLTGVGGVGKTRMAVEAGWMIANEFPDGVSWCELAPVADPLALADAVSAVLSIRSHAGLSTVDSVVDALRSRRLLLVLDNCEHLLDAAAELVARVIQSCATVTVLATSREPLGIPGETVWAVRSLVPRVEGVELFCDRAAAADAEFVPSENDLALVGEICARLDGIPLAIELAAARVRSMTVADVAARLNDRFQFLRGGRRGVERHQTLWAAVGWSHDLLTEQERLLFDRLSVFAGGFDLEAVEAVCADERIDGVQVADMVAALVDKSMVVADRSGTHARYRVLETLRQFGEEQLTHVDDVITLGDRHLAHYAAVAEMACARYEGRAYSAGRATFDAEWDNLRVAMQWSTTQRDLDAATRILRALFFFSWIGVRDELGHWAEALLDTSADRSSIFGTAGFFAAVGGDYARAVGLADAGMATSAEVQSPPAWTCWYAATLAHWYSGRIDEAWSAVQALNNAINPDHEPFAAAFAATTAAIHAIFAEPHAAIAYATCARQIAVAMHNPALDVLTHWASGAHEQAAGRVDRAFDHFEAAVVLADETGNRLMAGTIRVTIAGLAVMTNSPRAHDTLREALTHVYANRDWMDVWHLLETVAVYWAKTGRTRDAAVVLGHLEAGGIRSVSLAVRHQKALVDLQTHPDAQTWMAHGAALDRHELVRHVLEQLADASEPTR